MRLRPKEGDRLYIEMFAKTLAAANFRLFCAIVSAKDWETDHIDAIETFTQSDVHVDADI